MRIDNKSSDSPCSYEVGSYAALKTFLERCANVNESIREELFHVFHEEYLASQRDKQLPLFILITTIILFTMMIVIGTLGSSLVIYVILRKPSMRTRSNLFIMNLAISDITLCLVTQPFTLYRLLIGDHPWTMGAFMCKFSAMLQGTNIFVSTMSITAIAMDRFKCIIYPTIQTSNNVFTLKLLCLVWCIAIVLASPLTYFSHLTQQDVLQCTEKTEDLTTQKCKMIYSLTALVVQYVLPLLIVTAVYSRVCLKIHQRWLRERGKRDIVLQSEQCNRLLLPSNLDRQFVNKRSVSGEGLSNSISPFKKRMCSTDAHVYESSRNKLELPRPTPSRSIIPTVNEPNRSRGSRPIILLTGIAVIFGLGWLPLNIINVWMDIREVTITMNLMHPSDGISEWGPEQSNGSISRNRGDTNQTASDNHQTILLTALSRGGVGSFDGNIILIVQTICLSLVLSSACLNPILYGWLNENFRKEFLLVFHKCPKRCWSNRTDIRHTVSLEAGEIVQQNVDKQTIPLPSRENEQAHIEHDLEIAAECDTNFDSLTLNNQKSSPTSIQDTKPYILQNSELVDSIHIHNTHHMQTQRTLTLTNECTVRSTVEGDELQSGSQRDIFFEGRRNSSTASQTYCMPLVLNI